MPLFLYFCRHKPTSLFKPKVRLLAQDSAGVAVADAADALAGSPAHVEDAVNSKDLPFLKFDLDRAHFALCVEAHKHRHIFLFPLHRYPPKKPTGWTV